MITERGTRSPTMVKAQVSPGLRVKTKPQIEQRSNCDHPENSGPSPQCGQRLRNPRRSAVPINFDREGVIHKVHLAYDRMPAGRSSKPGLMASCVKERGIFLVPVRGGEEGCSVKFEGTVAWLLFLLIAARKTPQLRLVCAA